LKGRLGRLVRFALVGGVATGVQYVTLIVLVRAAGVWPTAASAIGFMVSAVGNYLLNYYFTFRSRGSHGVAAGKFLVLAGVGLAINSVLMQVLVGAGWHYILAQVCATVVVFLWNFVGNSLWTFGVAQHGDVRSRP
jgi:putative flippase GtrA